MPKKRARLLVPLLLAVLTALAYWQVLDFEFVDFDDDDYVRENLVVRAGLTPSGLRWAWTTGAASNWHPLTWLSHMLDVELFGLDGGGHHATSLILHVLNVLLLFGALRSLCGSTAASGLAAALFALHPLHVESVAWVAERKDVLSTAFGFAALWAYSAFAHRGGALRYGLVAVLLAASLCSKPMFVTLPFLLLLLDAWPLGRWRGGPAPAAGVAPSSTCSLGGLVAEKLPLLALAAASALVTYLVQDAGGATSTGLALGFGARVTNAVVAYVLYLGKTIAPLGLAMFYPHPSLASGPGWSAGAVVGSAAVLLAVSAGALAQWRRRPYLLVGWLWFLGTLVPVIGVVQVGAQALADRYTYVALVGPFLALSFAWSSLVATRPRLRAALVAGAMATCLACAWLTRRQAATWRNSEALATHALAVTERNWIANAMLGSVRREQGRHGEAIELYRRSLALVDHEPSVHNNRGLSLFELGRPQEAIAAYERALALRPDYVQAHNNLARSLSFLGRFDEAWPHYRAALRVDPDFIDAHNNLAADLARQGRVDEALPHFERVLRSNPTPRQALTVHVNMGVAFAGRMDAARRRGDLAAARTDRERAVRHFRAARELDPDHPLPAQLLRQLGADS